MIRPRASFFFLLLFKVIVYIALASLLVMLLWNNLVPTIVLEAQKINYWQAVGLLVLFRLLSGTLLGLRRPPFRNKEFIPHKPPLDNENIPSL
ncbi:MAG: hypothetical protein EAZ55_03260 [Cytophagales bacterium]|nr:MAG: hypothetical protein EAZ55_03260 [Cytophagales bacterium]